MFIPLAGAGLPASKAEPTALLSLVAGEFAAAVAARWPAPHLPFLTASAARRHLACLALTCGRDEACDVVLEARIPRAMACAVGSPPRGLARAITRMGEVAWAAADYRKLLELLAHPAAAKVLWHAGAVTPEMVRMLSALPPAMGGAAHLAVALDEGAVGVLHEVHAVIRARDGEAAAEAAASGWARAPTLSALFEAVRDDLCPEPAAPPFRGTALLKPLASKRALRSAAKRFGNCLADLLPYAASGWSAYYEWLGRPGAVVELTRDHVFGWRLEQARLAGNAPVPEGLRAAIARELAHMGAHVGRSGWELERAITSRGGADYPLRPAEQAIAEVFGAG